jgi:hypothetical protein
MARSQSGQLLHDPGRPLMKFVLVLVVIAVLLLLLFKFVLPAMRRR